MVSQQNGSWSPISLLPPLSSDVGLTKGGFGLSRARRLGQNRRATSFFRKLPTARGSRLRLPQGMPCRASHLRAYPGDRLPPLRDAWICGDLDRAGRRDVRGGRDTIYRRYASKGGASSVRVHGGPPSHPCTIGHGGVAGGFRPRKASLVCSPTAGDQRRSRSRGAKADLAPRDDDHRQTTGRERTFGPAPDAAGAVSRPGPGSGDLRADDPDFLATKLFYAVAARPSIEAMMKRDSWTSTEAQDSFFAQAWNCFHQGAGR